MVNHILDLMGLALSVFIVLPPKRRGVSQLKEHLGHIPWSVEACHKVPNHVKGLMSQKVTDGRIRRARGKKLHLFVENEVAATRHGYRSAIIPLDEEAQIDMAMRNSLRNSFSTLEHDGYSPFGKSTGSASGAASCSTGKQKRYSRYYKNTQDTSRGLFDIDLAHSRTQVQSTHRCYAREGSQREARDSIGKMVPC
jgi:hypothetical protein